MISARIVADSKNEFENRLTTMVVTFPRIILAEFNTHRMFSRNSASSRAIPFNKMLEMVKTKPFIPIAWQKDHSGMQGTAYFETPEEIDELNQRWLSARDNAVESAKELAMGITYSSNIDSGDAPNSEYTIEVTKQLCNRLLEPFMMHTVIVTASEFENFFYLRCPKYEVEYEGNKVQYRSKKDILKITNEVPNHPYNHLTKLSWLQLNKGQAEIHMMALAEAMWDAFNESTPKDLKSGEWHIPFGDNINYELSKEKYGYQEGGIENEPGWLIEGGEDAYYKELNNIHIKIATARCARVSYTVVGEEGKPDNYENDIKLHDRLAASGHWSPMEHCAKSMSKDEYEYYRDISMLNENDKGKHKGKSWGWSANFKGFLQYRKTFSNENVTK